MSPSSPESPTGLVRQVCSTRILGARRVIEALLPGATLHELDLSELAFHQTHQNHRYNDHSGFGTILDGGTFYLWQRLPNCRRHQIEIVRKPIPITKREREILLSFEKTQRGLFTSDAS